MTEKPVRHPERLEIHYDRRHWQQLSVLRSKAIKLMEILERANPNTRIHGSIARGDITPKSDLDIFIPNPSSSFSIAVALERAGIQIGRRLLIQATPYYAAKGYIEIGGQQTVSFPLVKMHRVEREFYQFSGQIGVDRLKDNGRVVGVDKRLMLIQPTDRGHLESSIVGGEEQAARLLRISAETVFDRVHALLRRDRIGRTGVFIERELAPDETFEMALKKLAEARPEVRRRLKFYEKR